jgi:L-rhamnose mutarotase
MVITHTLIVGTQIRTMHWRRGADLESGNALGRTQRAGRAKDEERHGDDRFPRDEYRRRHDALWPDLALALKDAGISDYSIFLDETSGHLFATLKRPADHRMDALPHLPVMRRWWDYMAELMETEADHAPVVIPLTPMFHLG